MKARDKLIFFLLMPFCIQGDPVIYNTVSFNPIIQASPTVSVNQESNPTAQACQTFLQTTYSSAQEHFAKTSHAMIAYIKKNAFKIFLASLSGLYGGIYMFMVYEHKRLQDPSSWILWNKQVSTKAFDEYSLQQIEQELVVEIQRRYFNPKDPVNYVAPLIIFWNEIEQEILLLELYLIFVKYLSCRPMRWLFPMKIGFEKKAKKATKRLYAIKKIFLQWITSRNVAAQALVSKKID